MEATINNVQKLSSPNPFCLITSKDGQGKTNIMALSWWTYVSNKPATIAIFISQRSYTRELIERSGEFGLCAVDERLVDKAFDCGTVSGRDVDKAAEFGIDLISPVKISTKLVKFHTFALECEVSQSLPVKDHMLFIAEVKQIHLNPQARLLFSWDGYSRLAAAKEA